MSAVSDGAAWVVRSGREGKRTVDFNLRESVVTLGWGDWVPRASVAEHGGREELDRHFDRYFSEFKNSTRRTARNEILRFRDRMFEGDIVVMPLTSSVTLDEWIAIGKVLGPMERAPSNPEGAHLFRRVEWLGTAADESLVQPDLAASIKLPHATVFQPRKAARAAARLVHLAAHGEDPGPSDVGGSLSNMRTPARPNLDSMFRDDLGASAVIDSEPDNKPLMATLTDTLGLRIQAYLWHATAPYEHEVGAHKIQITLPGAKRNSKIRILHDPGRLVLFCGFAAEFDTWSLWDAELFMVPEGISWSRNLQVSIEALTDAVACGVSTSTKNVRRTVIGSTAAGIITCRRSNLIEAIEARFRLNILRSLDGGI